MLSGYHLLNISFGSRPVVEISKFIHHVQSIPFFYFKKAEEFNVTCFNGLLMCTNQENQDGLGKVVPKNSIIVLLEAGLAPVHIFMTWMYIRYGRQDAPSLCHKAPKRLTSKRFIISFHFQFIVHAKSESMVTLKILLTGWEYSKKIAKTGCELFFYDTFKGARNVPVFYFDNKHQAGLKTYERIYWFRYKTEVTAELWPSRTPNTLKYARL